MSVPPPPAARPKNAQRHRRAHPTGRTMAMDPSSCCPDRWISSAFGLHVEPNDPVVHSGSRDRITVHYQRIVAGNNVTGRSGQRPQFIESFEHVVQAVEDREG